MTQDLMQAAKAALLRSTGPMTISQIRTAVAKEMRVPAADRFRKEIQAGFSDEAGVYAWPMFKKGPVYCSRPLSECVDEALLRALDEEPLTVKKAGKAVRKLVPNISENRAEQEIRVLLPRQASSGKIVRLSPNRQAVIYLSRSWMAKQAGADGVNAVGEVSGVNGPAGSLAPSVLAAILAAVGRLQSISGTYVRIDYLRSSPELRTMVDEAVIRLADKRKLVLARYDGPVPVPEDRKSNYVEDARGELFIGVAIPRASKAEA